MVERLKQFPKRIAEIWNNWTRKQKTIIISSAAVLLIAVIILIVALNKPNYQVLTTCKDYNEMSQVTKILSDAGYSYEVADNTLVVKVKKADLTAAKMAIASGDIKSDGYSF